MKTNENINELMVAIEEVLGIKIDWIEENGKINLDYANLLIIVEALGTLLTKAFNEGQSVGLSGVSIPLDYFEQK